MAIDPVTAVLPTSEARANLSPTLERFRREGVTAAPVVFGSHRKPEGVVMPFEMFERLLPVIEDVLLAEVVRARLDSAAPSEPFDTFVTDELGFDLANFES